MKIRSMRADGQTWSHFSNTPKIWDKNLETNVNTGNVVDIHYQSAHLANQKMPRCSFASLMAETENMLNMDTAITSLRKPDW